VKESTPSDQPRRPRGRPKTYEHATALDAALGVFWTKGYSGTSLDDLTQAMEMSRPSVYAAFGNKKAIYEAAVNHYVATIGSRYLVPLHKERSLRAGLLGFYAAQIDVVTGKHGPLGCVVACTMPAEAGEAGPVREHLAGVLAQIDGAVLERCRAARSAGELPKDADPAALSRLVTSGMLALSIRARSGMPRRELTRLARSFVDLMLPPG
jgi:AcrR family transcriptional regulator